MKIIKEDLTHTVYNEDGTVLCKGFYTIDMALHAIWVLDGSNENKFFSERNGFVLVETKL